MSILGDIDTQLEHSDMQAGIVCERKINLHVSDFETVANNSCHFSILKKFEGRKSSNNVREQILKYEWHCVNILRFFGLNDIYKGVTICIKVIRTDQLDILSPITGKLIMIFRGYKRKDDFAFLNKTFTNKNYNTDNVCNRMIDNCLIQLKYIFDTSDVFNLIFQAMVRYVADKYKTNQYFQYYDKYIKFN